MAITSFSEPAIVTSRTAFVCPKEQRLFNEGTESASTLQCDKDELRSQNSFDSSVAKRKKTFT